MSKSDNMRNIEFRAGYDKRDPDPKKNYGVAGVHIGFYYGNPVDGFVQFTIITDWYPTCIGKNEKKGMNSRLAGIFPMPADLGYHSPVPHYDDHGKMDCDRMEQGFCYYDGSTLNAERIMKILTDEGSDAVWKELEEFWDDTFSNQEDGQR